MPDVFCRFLLTRISGLSPLVTHCSSWSNMPTMVLLPSLSPPGVFLHSYLQGYSLTLFSHLLSIPMPSSSAPPSRSPVLLHFLPPKNPINLFSLSFSSSLLTPNLWWVQNPVFILCCILYNLDQYPVPKRYSTNVFQMNQSSSTCTDSPPPISMSSLPQTLSFYFFLANLPT